jgi:cell division protein FtsQ
MWDNPRLLNLAANALYAAAAALFIALVWHAALRVPQTPVRAVTLTGDLAHVDARAVHSLLVGRVAGNFFGVNIDEVRRLVAGLPWVRQVEVRREWPDRLVVRIEEHHALGRWPGARLVSDRGEVFDGTTEAELPQLAGPPGSEREVTRRYLALHELFAPLGLEPVQLGLSARYAWQVKLSNGLVIELGRDEPRAPVEERLARFVAAYPRVVASLNRGLDYVDLRCPNGFAIRVPDLLPGGDGDTAARKRS